jgi:hypothetical protein
MASDSANPGDNTSVLHGAIWKQQPCAHCGDIFAAQISHHLTEPISAYHLDVVIYEPYNAATRVPYCVVVDTREIKGTLVSDDSNSAICTRQLLEILKGLRIITAIIDHDQINVFVRRSIQYACYTLLKKLLLVVSGND